MTSINEWLASAVGRRMNPDGRYGLQCVDAVDQYAEDLFGVPWPQSVGGVAGARQLLDAAPDEYWERIDYYHGLTPQRGDVLVFAGDSLNQWGHTAVVESADNVGINVIQQDGFAPPTRFVDGAYYSDKPAHRARLAYSDRGTGPLLGVLRPRQNKIIGVQLQSGPTITPLPEDDMFTDQDRADLKLALDRANRAAGVADEIEKDRIRERVIALDDRTALMIREIAYVKSAAGDTLYEVNRDDNTLRPIGLTEWEATGKPYVTYTKEKFQEMYGREA